MTFNAEQRTDIRASRPLDGASVSGLTMANRLPIVEVWCHAAASGTIYELRN
jgi:hypothetical protein